MKWMKVDEARRYAGGVSRKLIYRAVANGRLRAARVGTGRSLLFHDHWIDAWLVECATPTASAAESKELNTNNGLHLVEKAS
jgi:excisionase family DNA binding protein